MMNSSNFFAKVWFRLIGLYLCATVFACGQRILGQFTMAGRKLVGIQFYMHNLAPKIPFLSIFSLITCIYLYLAYWCCINYPYWWYLTICAIYNHHMYSSIEAAPVCRILEQSDNYSLIYCISKNCGLQKVSSRMQLYLYVIL